MFTTSYVSETLDRFRYFKELGDRAMAQIPDQALFTALDPLSNSIAIIVKHLAGNMRSRWVDFFTTDGDKPDRNRDAEFESPPGSREEVLHVWESAWNLVLAQLEQLSDADLGRVVTLRGREQSVMQAINMQITHCAYHVGQVVFLAKHFAGPDWSILTVPRGKSKEYSAGVRTGNVTPK